MSAAFLFGSDLNELLTADTALELEPRAGADVTDHPMESGSTMSDGITTKPRRIALELFFSAVPEREGLLPDGPARPETARKRLLRACESGETFFLNVDGQTYYPAAFVSVSTPRAASDGDGRRVRVEVRELLVAESSAKRVKKKRTSKNVRHKGGATDRGMQAAVDLLNTSASDARSLLVGLADPSTNVDPVFKPLDPLPPPPARVVATPEDWSAAYGEGF